MIVPHSLTDLGEILMNEKQWDAAENNFRKVKNYTGYDFSQLLEWRIKNNFDKLQLLKKADGIKDSG